MRAVTLLRLLQWPRKGQLVAVRIEHMEIPFAPRRVLRPSRIKSPFLKICPERIHVSHLENHSSPASHRMPQLQIQHGRLHVFGAQR